MKEARFRDNVTWMSFLLTLLVIWTHSLNAELFLGAGAAESLAGRVETVLGERIGQIAVPGFFMLSSMLFYRTYTRRSLERKLIRRVHSLLIPYLLWNFIYYLGYLIATHLPVLREITGKDPVPADPRTILEAVFLYKYNPLFWFVFQLMILSLLAPVFWEIVRRPLLFRISVLALCLVIFFRFDPTPLNSDACLYWLVSARLTKLSRRKPRPGEHYVRHFDPEYAIVGLILFLAAAGLFLLGRKTANDLPVVLCRMTGALGLWLFLRALPLPSPVPVMYDTFLIYAVHFPPVRLINKTAEIALHGNGTAALIIFLLLPWLIVMLTGWFSYLGRNYTPLLHDLLTGRR